MSIIFDQLRISDNGKRMYIDAHVNKADMFADTSIEKLYICLGNQIYETQTVDPESNGFIFKKEYSLGTKEIHEVISIGDSNLIYSKTAFNELYFVYIKCNGVPEECKCLATVGNYFLGVTFDESLLYQQVMGYTKELADNCTMPQDFVDFILNWNAFKASVETEHYVSAIKFWERLFGKGSAFVYKTTKPCGCHG